MEKLPMGPCIFNDFHKSAKNRTFNIFNLKEVSTKRRSFLTQKRKSFIYEVVYFGFFSRFLIFSWKNCRYWKWQKNFFLQQFYGKDFCSGKLFERKRGEKFFFEQKRQNRIFGAFFLQIKSEKKKFYEQFLTRTLRIFFPIFRGKTRRKIFLDNFLNWIFSD